MRRVVRPNLGMMSTKYLAKKQAAIDNISSLDDFNATKEWNKTRQTKIVRATYDVLREMMGQYERCIYCHDSHGSDIEHFWPKTKYPGKMFAWPNLLLCCAECGRFKGDEFPISNGQPLLIDPTTEEPWEFLDFDSTLGVIVPAYDPTTNATSQKGEETVRILELDRREALHAAYLRTFRRLSSVARHALAGAITAGGVYDELSKEDDHGLMGWCIIGPGKNVDPFRELRTKRADIWNMCEDSYRQSVT